MIDYLSVVKIFNKLKGEKIQYITRSMNLINIGIGKMILKRGTNGKNRTVASYALHVQCAFRIVCQNQIMTGSDELYIIANDENGKSQERSLFDEKMCDIQESFRDEYVKSVHINMYGDLEIVCSTYRIYIFVTGDSKCEAWRFFEVNTNKKHLVLSGGKFEVH